MALQLKRSIDESPQENLMKVAEELFNKLLEENKDETDVLYDMALQLKRSIDESPQETLMKVSEELFNKLLEEN